MSTPPTVPGEETDSHLDLALAKVKRRERLTPEQERMLESAVPKLRAEMPLTKEERAAVLHRGLELMDLRFDQPPPDGSDDDLDDEETEDLCARLVEVEADRREGKRLIPWRELFPAHAAE